MLLSESEFRIIHWLAALWLLQCSHYLVKNINFSAFSLVKSEELFWKMSELTPEEVRHNNQDNIPF